MSLHGKTTVLMTKKQYILTNSILVLVGLILLIELIIDAHATGDFIGYVNAGNLVLNGKFIYLDYLNTWPPFFSIFSVILAWGDSLSKEFIRIIWNIGSLISGYYVIRLLIELLFKQKLEWKHQSKGIIIQDPLIVVPLLIMLRFIMDNMSNVQINMYMLFCSLLAIKFFIQKKYMWTGFLLGLTISLKIYTVFFLFYFLFKREFKPVFWTLVFVGFFNAICFLVFGMDTTIQYFSYWVNEVTPRSFIANHNNQSLFGTFLRLFTTEDPTHGLYVNIMSLDPHFIKKMTYLTVVVTSLFPAFLLKKKLKHSGSVSALLEYSMVFTAIPILSPIAWKAYFIFLWVPYFLLYAILFRSETSLSPKWIKTLKWMFWITVLMNVGSTELFVGMNFSDVLEAYSVITIGTIVLIGMQLYVLLNIHKFDTSSIRFISIPNSDK